MRGHAGQPLAAILARVARLWAAVCSSLRRRWLAHLLAFFAMTVGFILLGGALIAAETVARLTENWGRGVSLTVYFDADFDTQRLAALKRVLGERPEVRAVRFVPSAEAYARLERSLGRDAKHWAIDAHAELLPASLEVTLADGIAPEARQPLIAMLAALRGVQEVDYSGVWAERLGRLAALLRYAAAGLAFFVGLAVLVLIGTTTRLAALDRGEDVNVQRYLGATRGFIIAPFVVEGAVQGMLAAGVALGVLYGLHRIVATEVVEQLGALTFRLEASFFSPEQIMLGLCSAALVGLGGSAMAVRRYVQA